MARDPGQLPIPRITARPVGARCLPALADRCPVRARRRARPRGVRRTRSAAPCAEARMPRSTWADHVRRRPWTPLQAQPLPLVLAALGAAGVPLVVPSQVHGHVVVGAIDDASDTEDARCRAQRRRGRRRPACRRRARRTRRAPVLRRLRAGGRRVPDGPVRGGAHAGWRGAVSPYRRTRPCEALALRDVQGAGAECAPSRGTGCATWRLPTTCTCGRMRPRRPASA